ncbi:MAG: hypothetical protein JSW15_09875, partial [Deltaproteobacteria bacterium]
KIQSFEPVVSPPGEAKPDWEILDLLGNRMGFPERYLFLQRIRAEIRRQIPMYSELGDGTGESWIKETSQQRLFQAEGQGELIPFTPVVTTESEAREKDYPFKAILGSLRFHLGSGTRTGYSDRIKDFELKGEVEISPEDGAKLNLKEGDEVRISSPHGAITRKVGLKRDLRPGLIFIPMAFHNNDARQLIGLTQLGIDDSPGWKEVHVKVEKAED